MASIIVLRNIGPTVASSVTASATTAANVPAPQIELMAFASFLNTGAAAVAITITAQNSANGSTAPASVLPVAGTPQTVIMLPALMTFPVVYSVPNGFSFTAIGAAAGPSLVYITPVGIQS